MMKVIKYRRSVVSPLVFVKKNLLIVVVFGVALCSCEREGKRIDNLSCVDTTLLDAPWVCSGAEYSIYCWPISDSTIYCEVAWTVENPTKHIAFNNRVKYRYQIDFTNIDERIIKTIRFVQMEDCMGNITMLPNSEFELVQNQEDCILLDVIGFIITDASYIGTYQFCKTITKKLPPH